MASVTDLRAEMEGAEVRLSWRSTAPDGSFYQIYMDGVHVDTTDALAAVVPVPAGPADCHVGAVTAAERWADFAGSLPPPLAPHASLSWYGGRYVVESIDHYAIYRSAVPGGPVDYGAPVATVPAFPGGVYSDGAGVGPAGKGGAGRSAKLYTWDSGRLASGAWTFAVAAVDGSGVVESSPPTTALSAAAAPLSPSADAQGRRVRAAVDPASRVPTLTWGASPG